MCFLSLTACPEIFPRDKGKKDGLSSRCKDCTKKARTAWVENNRGTHDAYHKAYREKNREKLKTRNRIQYEKNRDSRIEYANAYRLANTESVNEAARKRYASCPTTRISFSVSSRLRRSFSGGQEGIFRHLPYTRDELRRHLERQFSKGMSWENYGKWHIDHIRPVSSFSYTSTLDIEFIECWSLCNLRPLWAEENLRKSNSITHII